MPDIQQAKRIVIKLGTQIVTREDGALALDRLAVLVSQCAQLVHRGKEVLLVSSGAVGLGRQVLKLHGPIPLTEKQACATVGQSLLMNAYRELFHYQGLITGQVLLTAGDFSHRKRYLNLRETLEKLLSLRVVPIINENDAVSTMELEEETATKSFGDNDNLSALLASKLEADLLVILTNVEGIFTENPAQNPQAELLRRIESFDQLSGIHSEGQSAYGRGGMTSKIAAARIAAISGVETVITSGLRTYPLDWLLDGGDDIPGTHVLAQQALPGRKRWIALASGYNGVVVVNEGARRALVERQASLLPVGVVDVRGDFQPRQVVSIQDEQGTELGRGLIHFSAEELRRIQGLPSQEIPAVLGDGKDDVVIRRDDLVIFQEFSGPEGLGEGVLS